jgi:hypothetical protein
MEFDNLSRNGKPQAQAAEAMRAGLRMIALRKRLENTAQFFASHADTVVGHFQVQMIASVCQKSLNGDFPAFGRELHGVLQNIPEYLLEPDGIAAHLVWLGFLLEIQLNLFFSPLQAGWRLSHRTKPHARPLNAFRGTVCRWQCASGPANHQ